MCGISGVDCRTERTQDEILRERTWDLVFERCRKEIVKGETKHLIVLLGVVRRNHIFLKRELTLLEASSIPTA